MSHGEGLSPSFNLEANRSEELIDEHSIKEFRPITRKISAYTTILVFFFVFRILSWHLRLSFAKNNTHT